MKKTLLFVAGAVLVALLAALLAAPLTPSGSRAVQRESFLPPNNLRIPVGSIDAKGITQEKFNAVMERAESIYAPIIAARGGKLVLRRLWDNPTVNASAQRSGSDYIVNMYGGLARHETITQDGMALVVCHELGHHLGGAPKYDGMDWASNEGEADYFANAKCLHRLFAVGSESFSRLEADDAVARRDCATAYKGEGDRAVCYRSAMAGMSVTKLFQALRRQTKDPHFDTPDPSVVTEMYDAHPDTQCRLDTYYQGSLCTQPFSKDFDESDPTIGACTRLQGYSLGMRPRCWYLPPDGEPSGAPGLAAISSKPRTESATLAALKSRSEAAWTGL